MTPPDLLRPSRDGDQFHYLWAARQSLRLLEPGTRLDSIWVEAVSDGDTSAVEGLEVIDIAEYWGTSDLATADRVIYRQLKHSSRQVETEWTISFLRTTLVGFARHFAHILHEYPDAAERVRFEIVSNRPAALSVYAALQDLATGRSPAQAPRESAYVRRLLATLDEPQIGRLCRQLRIDDTAPHLLRLRPLFEQDLSALLPGAPADYALRLREMIGSRATSEREREPFVRRADVLAAIGTSEERLLPAPSLLKAPTTLINTAHVSEVLDQITSQESSPILVHAPGGVGKSVLAQSVGASLPAGSLALVYDCFGNGTYRRPSAPRHEPRQALVQIINELAARGLCDPLIPSDSARPDDYFRAFMSRVRNAARMIAARGPEALLVLVIDAADNAALMAQETGTHSFVPGLLRESLPDNTRLVALCRTERRHRLEAPARHRESGLSGFEQSESAAHLRSVFPHATDRDAAEFHARTGGNPRVQVTVLESAGTVEEALNRLGEAAGTDRDILDRLMQQLVDDLKDQHHHSAEIDHICTGLAALRPMIPVRVLAQLARVDASMVESFVADLGHPLLIDDGTVQFRDEPTETWFRRRFRPTGEDLDAFLDRLRPLAATDPYAAASIPALLWEAGRVDDLITLALSADALPTAGLGSGQPEDLQRREIDQERAQFALKAALRHGREFEAGRLALKVGALAAGRTRRLDLIREHTDLAAAFLDPRVIEQLVATRSLTGSWPNSNLPVEGALLSGASGQTDQARSRLRSAFSWMTAWSRQATDEDSKSGIELTDIAQVAWGLLNTDGAAACVGYLRRWRPKTVAFDAGVIVARRLVDAGRVTDLEHLAEAGGPNHLKFAIAQACSEAGLILQPRAVRHVLSAFRGRTRRLPLSNPARYGRGIDEVADHGVAAATWAVASGLRYRLLKEYTATKILRQYLSADLGHLTGGRFDTGIADLLAGHALLARLQGQRLDADAVAGKEIRDAKDRPSSSSSRLREYDANVRPLVPWTELWVDILLGSTAEVGHTYRQLSDSTFAKTYSYEPPFNLLNGACRIAIHALALGSDADQRNSFTAFCTSHTDVLSRASLMYVVRVASAHTNLQSIALELATALRSSIDRTRGDAAAMSNDLIRLARATYRLDDVEARSHFQQAVTVADRVGEDAHARWTTLLAITTTAGAGGIDSPERAYRITQVAENLEPYLGDYLDLAAALQAAGKLSATTAISVASRWRDRRVATVAEVARALSDGPDPLLRSMPVAAAGLIPLNDHLDSLAVMQRAMRQRPEEARAVVKVLSEFERPVRYSHHALQRLDAVAAEVGIELDGTLLAPAIRVVAEPYESSGSRRWLSGDGLNGAADTEPSTSKDTEDPLARIDLTTASGWSDALTLASGRSTAIRREDVFERVAQTPQARRARVVAAFRKCPQIDAWDVARLLAALGDPDQLPFGVRAEIRELARTVTARFYRELILVAWDHLDLARMSQIAGESGADYLGQALRALGTTPETLGAEEAFALATRLAVRTSPTQAARLFDDCVHLFDEVAGADAGDGPYATLPTAPATVPHALAGVLWSALGDAFVATRWRAAHAVRLLLALGCTDIADLLLDLAMGRTAVAPFVDARLAFYDRHARQWLLFALARAAHDPSARAATARLEPFLRHVLFDAEPHIVMQHSGRHALLALTASGTITLSEIEAETVNHLGTATAIVESDGWHHGRRNVDGLALIPKLLERDSSSAAASLRPEPTALPQAADSTAARDDEPRFRFFFDFEDYWCKPLGDAFDIDAASIKRLTREILLDHWQTPFRGESTEDARQAHELYERGHYTHGGEHPPEDDLDFYLALHGLYELAGHLIATLPVITHSGHDQTEWEDFLQPHVPTRTDGRWLADRRDAAHAVTVREPDYQPSPRDTVEVRWGDEWKYEISNPDFDTRLAPAPGWISVWQRSHAGTYSRSETVGIHSALVTPESGPALLRALQTAPDARAFRIPSADDDEYQFDVTGHQLIGWIRDPNYRREGCDRRDPHARAISFPPPAPTEEIAAVLGASADNDLRSWRVGNRESLQSLVWDETEPASRDRGSSGDRLMIRDTDLTELLGRLDRSLIVEVMISRTAKITAAQRLLPKDLDDDDLRYTAPYTKYFLFDQHGSRHQL